MAEIRELSEAFSFDVSERKEIMKTFIEVGRKNYKVLSKKRGISIIEYLRIFFREIVNGRQDYYNLLPMIIGISNNKL